jgi:hypothetical protein
MMGGLGGVLIAIADIAELGSRVGGALSIVNAVNPVLGSTVTNRRPLIADPARHRCRARGQRPWSTTEGRSMW